VGEIGEVCIYNYALSSSQVRINYNNSCSTFAIAPVITALDTTAVDTATTILNSLSTNPTSIDFTNAGNKSIITNYFNNIYSLIQNVTPTALPVTNPVINAYYASLNPTYFTPATVINYISTALTSSGFQGYTNTTISTTLNSISLLPLESGGRLAKLDVSGNVQGYIYRNSLNQVSTDNSTWVSLNGTFTYSSGVLAKVIGIGSPLVLTFLPGDMSYINTTRGLLSFQTYIDGIEERVIKYSSISNQIYCFDLVSNTYYITYGRYNNK